MSRAVVGEGAGLAEIAAVIPAYDASATIVAVVQGALRHLETVLVVDDGSTDETPVRAATAGAQVLRHPGNRGKGAALRTAFRHLAREGIEAVVTLDADGQHDPADIPLLVETFRTTGADLVVGSREAGFARMSRGRRFGNRFSSRALAFVSGLRLPDTQSGYRLYSTRFVREADLSSDSYDAEMALLLEAALRRLHVVSVPVRVPLPDGRSCSHYRPWVDTYRICRTVIRLALRRSGRGHR